MCDDIQRTIRRIDFGCISDNRNGINMFLGSKWMWFSCLSNILYLVWVMDYFEIGIQTLQVKAFEKWFINSGLLHNCTGKKLLTSFFYFELLTTKKGCLCVLSSEIFKYFTKECFHVNQNNCETRCLLVKLGMFNHYLLRNEHNNLQ